VLWADWFYENGYELPRQLEWKAMLDEFVFDRDNYDETLAKAIEKPERGA
jgi:hypothetical protein